MLSRLLGDVSVASWMVFSGEPDFLENIKALKLAVKSVGYILAPWLVLTRLVFSFRGNWIGEAPYQHGRPCSQCPPSYGGVCKDNLCYKGNYIIIIL